MLCHFVKASVYFIVFTVLLFLVPVGKPLLTVIPVPGNIEEGSDVILICNIPKGSPPISFSFYGGTGTEIYRTTVQMNSSSYNVSAVKRQHSGNYYCEANNQADALIKSDTVTVEGELYLYLASNRFYETTFKLNI